MTNGYFDNAFGTWLPDDPIYFCYKCYQPYDEDDLIEVGNSWLCEDCVAAYCATCDICGKLFFETDLTETPDGRRICEDCYEDSEELI